MNNEFSPIRVKFVYLPVVNLAIQQNGVSLIREFTIENKTNDSFKDILILLKVEPEFATIVPYAIEKIAVGDTVRIETFRLNLSTDFFTQLTEKITGSFQLEIYSGKDILFRQTYPIDVLAYDEWGGLTVLPEMLSAFVIPNNPSIIPVLKRAGEILEQWTGSPSLDEYQSRNSDRVRKQMAAIYTALSEMNIIYSSVPASFEKHGQRIRMADTVLTQRIGTCLDMALLYASCLEAAGIHPLLIITQGHAFAGGWLIPETFPDSITDDVSSLTKRTAEGINEITLVETTCMNQGHFLEFDQSEKLANDKLATDFILAMDVKRSRFSGIRPLPQRLRQQEHGEVEEEEIEAIPDTTPENINPYDLSGIQTAAVLTKQMIWERKLLDLSLRNNLLDIRITKNTLQLISTDLHLLEDALADGHEFRVLAKPTDWENPLYDFGIYHTLSSRDPMIKLIRSEISQKRLRSYQTELELHRSLQHLYRSSRLSIEENGANTLYIALGLLKWYETPASQRPRYAPILLLPVEMVRKSAAQGYIIRSREEDTLMNITLLEMLHQNFGITISGLDPLPVDESGVNVKLIYSIIRNSIKEQSRWDVEEQAILGIFSFNKFIMWNDIHNNAPKLAENKIVFSLIDGKIAWDVQEEMADASQLDKVLGPKEILLPISADSSQLEAVYEAMNDRTFILHGPPGTGKSQTITNIIANALYKGKRVLFVAEKMAALSVVQNRLEAMGLAPFCLELHSNKAKKTAVLTQLKETTEIIKRRSPEEFVQQANRFYSLRMELNTYVDTLHKKYPFGFSIYETITQYQSIDTDLEVEFPVALVKELTEETLSQWNEAIEKLVSVGNACGHPYNHPLTGIYLSNYTAAIKEEVIEDIRSTVDLLNRIKQRIHILSGLLGENENYNKKQVDVLTAIINVLLRIPELTRDMLNLPRLTEMADEFREAVHHGKEKEKFKTEIQNRFSDDVLSIDAQRLMMKWNKYSNQWFLPKFFGQLKIKKQLNNYTLGEKIQKSDVRTSLNLIIKYHKEEKAVSSYEDQFSRLFGRYGRINQQDWTAIGQIIEDSVTLNNLILNYAQDIVRATTIKEFLSGHLAEGIDSFKSIHGRSLQELYDLLSELSSRDLALYQTIGMPPGTLYDDSDFWIDNALAKLNGWLTNIDKLKDWFQWLSVYDQLKNLGIGFIADVYRDYNIPNERIERVFTKSLLHTCVLYILSEEPGLELFKGKLFDDIIRKYKELTVILEKLTKQEIYAKLASNIPSFTQEATYNSEVGILQRNIKNNARGVSLRRLFDQIPTLLSRMCPCMLMSPISVAQFIDIDSDKFDLIIFDEASQMPTYEAVGAIARGRNMVIVGDPKQMPPTSFFMTNAVDEENIEVEDLESILDDCLALSMPSKYLLWHYRSKHESLIAFSNSEYYNNKLFTFPSPDNIESKVRLVPVQGYYDKGKSRQNKEEAQVIVKEIERRLLDKKLRKKSIGVVTFSLVQQTLIEDMLSDLFIFRPDLETIAMESEEPLFIKNLENVQGDERDVILFSIGYGPDKDGRVSMNFGPLNRKGGERRLNVAVSRARYEMIIFSALRPDQIDLNRTSSIGVAGLKRFLEYAQEREKVAADIRADGDSAPSIENIIAVELRKRGHTVHTNIGCSGYKVNIGIVNPQKEKTYSLGILCDGIKYKETKTTRDREVVQTNVLKLLGWHILRVWTMDWWENKEEVLKSIEDEIEKIRTGMQPEVEGPVIYEIPTVVEEEPLTSAPSLNQEASVSSEVLTQKEYTPVVLDIIVESSSESFFYPENKEMILSLIKKVMDSEAPISRSLLCRKILSAWGITRMGTRLNAYFLTLFQQLSYYQVTHERISFLWLSEEQCCFYSDYRVNSDRDAIDLPPEEVANAIKELMKHQISMPVKDLTRITAQLLGFSRGGTHVDAAMRRGMGEAVKRGFVKVNGDRVSVL